MSFFSALARAMGLASPDNQHIDSPLTSKTETMRRTSITMDFHRVQSDRITKNKKGRTKRKSIWDFSRMSSLFGKENNVVESEDDLEGTTLVDCDEPIPSTEDGNDYAVIKSERYAQNISIFWGNLGPPMSRLLSSKMVLKAKADQSSVTRKSARPAMIAPVVQLPRNRCFSPNDPRIADWSEDEIWLSNRLARRGLEPLFPHSLIMNYPTFPKRLFSRDPHRVFLTSHQGSEAGRKSFHNLLVLVSADVYTCQTSTSSVAS